MAQKQGLFSLVLLKPRLASKAGRGVSIPLSLGRDGAGCQENCVSLEESQLLVIGGDTAGTSYPLDPKQLELRWASGKAAKEEVGKEALDLFCWYSFTTHSYQLEEQGLL